MKFLYDCNDFPPTKYASGPLWVLRKKLWDSMNVKTGYLNLFIRIQFIHRGNTTNLIGNRIFWYIHYYPDYLDPVKRILWKNQI